MIGNGLIAGETQIEIVRKDESTRLRHADNSPDNDESEDDEGRSPRI